MFLLDTNVLSELRKVDRRDPEVAAWASSVDLGDLYLSAITILEIEAGTLSLARRDGPQAALLRKWIDGFVLPAFAGRILPVDTAVAQRCARLHVPDPCPERDALIGATALVHRFVMVTRNMPDFERMDVELINPWDWRASSTT
jgi:predicted nucleic acid-binding protein